MPLGERVDVRARQPLERARDDDDAVLARRLDEDRRGHRRRRRRSTASARTSLRLPERDRLVPERVVADRREEVDLGAEPRRADRLVRALAAVVAAERAADDRLPRLRHAVELDRQADPVAAHDRDPRHPRKSTSTSRRQHEPQLGRDRRLVPVVIESGARGELLHFACDLSDGVVERLDLRCKLRDRHGSEGVTESRGSPHSAEASWWSERELLHALDQGALSTIPP